ncbi:MAG TPA: EfeM/EfeO family lipoprotein [Solirubrobacteraceae bacterium]|jgi:high-affinity iron transporter|nr:EfeM/EfeO family lipoprotein [Solirubrobacteraceae bacterium]
MRRQGLKARAALTGVAALAVIALLVVVLSSASSTPGRPAATVPTQTAAEAASAAAATGSAYGPPPLARYEEGVPHVASALSVYGVQGQVSGAPTTPPEELPPVSPSAFRAPVAAYRSYSVARLRLMQGEISKLVAALAADDRGAAQAAWRGAYADYLNLGAVYLEGPISDLNDAIDGTPGGLPGGVTSPRFSGLHRLERGLWTGAPLTGLEPWARKLAADVTRLAKLVPSVAIDPLDFATRAHEILEDAVRDQLSGTDAPWSGAGVLGTAAGVVATTEVIKTLSPDLTNRETVLPTVEADMGSLRTTLATIQRAHGGTLPTTSQLTQDQSEQLDASLGQALEGLAQVPGVLEATRTPVVPQIPAADIKIDP